MFFITLRYALDIKHIGGLNMKLDDVVEVNLVDRSPKETYRPVREMAAKIITEDVEVCLQSSLLSSGSNVEA